MSLIPGPENEKWSFNQPVLLNKTNRNSSVLVWTLVGSTTIVISWAFMAPLPETVVVQGKLQPTKAVQEIEAPVPGVVRKVFVHEAQLVSEGDKLLSFDPRDVNAQLEAANANREALLNQVAINRAVLDEISAEKLTANQKNLLINRLVEIQSSNNANAEALASSQARIIGLRRSFETASTIYKRYEELLFNGAASELQVMEARTRVIQLGSALDAELREEARLKSRKEADSAERKVQMRFQIEDDLRKITNLEREIIQLNVLLTKIVLRAPISGKVFDLNVSPGSVVKLVNQQKPLLKLIPQDALQAIVYIPNNAIGFIKPAQRADISLAAFNSSDYGYLPASVQRVGIDALTATEQQRVLGTNANGLHFPAVLKLKHQKLMVGERAMTLQSGMSLTADIYLRNRRLISSITGLLENKRRSLERMR